MKAFVACLSIIFMAGLASAAGLRVAVWDPAADTDVPGNRFQLRRSELDAVAGWLADAGMSVQRVTADAMAPEARVLVLPGTCFPKQARDDLKRYTDGGGVVVTLEGMVPLLVRIEPGDDGKWRLSPSSPSFAWQSEELMRHFGFRYAWRPELHDQGTEHTPTPLLKRYLPDAAPFSRKLPGRWLPSIEGGKVLPLLESTRFDGVRVVPQIFVARRGTATGVFCTNIELATREMVVALVRLAGDIGEGKVPFDGAVTIPDSIPRPEPLRLRQPGPGVEPENARAIRRWGRFDGGSGELGDPLPRGLPAGKSVVLPLPELPEGPCYLRIRGAYDEPGAVLKVAAGDDVLWNEALSFLDAVGESNGGVITGGEPIEFNRIVFLPSPSPSVSIANPGTAPVYFDAVQVERHEAEPEVHVGFGIADWPGFPVAESESAGWPCVRAPLRLQLVGEPGDPDRWKKSDALLRDRFAKINPHIHGIIQNTPTWAALDEDHLREARANRRERDVAPDPGKYIALVEEFIARYGDVLDGVELWNEPNLKQFYWGSREEYVRLFKSLAPAIRRAKPDAIVIGPGFAGHSFEPYLRDMIASGAMDCVDWMAVHCYCGKGPAWDRIGYGYEGDLYALGVNKPVYANEQGFVFRNAQWFTPPPLYSEYLQGVNTGIGMARLMAGGICKVNVFMVGPGNHEFDVVRADGTPRPAYSVVKDYMALSRQGSTRLDFSMTSQDGTTLKGVYAAAARHPDGSATVLVNPAEVESLQPKRDVPNPSFDLVKPHGDWHGFQGKVAYAGDGVRLLPGDGQLYIGFGGSVTLDLDQWPMLEIDLPECPPKWSLSVRAGCASAEVFKDLPAGLHRIDLRDVLPMKTGVVDANATFRMQGPSRITAVRFLGAEEGGPHPAAVSEADGTNHAADDAQALGACIRLPLPDEKAEYGIEATVDGERVPASLVIVRTPTCSCAKIDVKVLGRTVIALTPLP